MPVGGSFDVKNSALRGMRSSAHVHDSASPITPSLP
jgi:hypothetical protein